MAKYRKKVKEVDAIQWQQGGDHKDVYITAAGAFIDTKHGPQLVRSGDWIITGLDGDPYPCSDELFHELYEPV